MSAIIPYRVPIALAFIFHRYVILLGHFLLLYTSVMSHRLFYIYIRPQSPRYGVGNTIFDELMICVYLLSLTPPQIPSHPASLLRKAGHLLRVNATPPTTHERRECGAIHFRTTDAKDPS